MDAAKQVRFRIQRYNPENGADPYVDEFVIPVTRGMTVLDGLFYIKENLDSSLAFRSSCRMAICGSCAMLINNFPHLACHTQIEELKASTLELEPVPNYPVIKDLVVDLAPLFEKHKAIKPYLIRSEAGEMETPSAEFLQTPQELEAFGDRFGFEPAGLVYASRMAAKVDSAGLQDGYQIYHHAFVFTGDGAWAVIQQGMNEATRWARRYHWLSSTVEDFVCEPHSAVCSDHRGGVRLNVVAEEAGQSREVSTQVAGERPEALVKELKRLQSLELPGRHHLEVGDIHPDKLARIFLKTYENPPPDFERLLGMEGVGPKTIRALALIAELVYGAKASVRDPARFSFAHGGKDGHPYPVDRRTYDRSIEVLRTAVSRAKLGRREKLEALRRLATV